MRIVLLGDSHLARIRRDLPRLGADVVNAAVGGATVHDLVPQAASAAIRPDDVVLVSVGTNDAAPWKQVPLPLFQQHLQQFIGACDSRRCVVLLPPGVVEARLSGTADRSNAVLDDYRAAVTAAAVSAGAEVVDASADLAGLGPSAFASDGVHLSGDGYDVLLEVLRAALALADDV